MSGGEVALDALILDFGGVLYPIDYDGPVRAFGALGFDDFGSFYHQAEQHEIFDSLETGSCTPEVFLETLVDRCKAGTTLMQVEAAWNSILLRMPISRMEWVMQLGEATRLFLFSNTNAIHCSEFVRRMDEDGYLQSFRAAFEAIHYSHELGRRKPHVESFLHLCALHGLVPERTGFVDDSSHHVAGARQAGMQAVHFHPERHGDLPRFLQNLGWKFS